MIIPYLKMLTKALSTDAIASALGLEIPTAESLLSGMYQPAGELYNEIRELYATVNRELLIERGLARSLARQLQYEIPEYEVEGVSLRDKLISKISWRDGVDPNIIANGLEQSEMSLEEIDMYNENVRVPSDWYETVQTEILYI